MRGIEDRRQNQKDTSVPVWGRRSARLGRQIVNLEVAGSNPVGPAIHHVGFGRCRHSFNP